MAFRKEKVGKETTCQVCLESYYPDNPSQHFCSVECAWNYWHLLQVGRKGKALAREIASGWGYRSLAELGFKVRMNEQEIYQVEYEPEHFKWQPKVKSYTPDWRVHREDGTFFYVEFKGKLDQVTRSILLGVKHDHPEMDLRLIFEKPKNKLDAGSKTRYFQWAEKNGFPWSSLQMGIPKEWMEVKK